MWLIWKGCTWQVAGDQEIWFEVIHSASARSGQKWPSLHIDLNEWGPLSSLVGQNGIWMHWTIQQSKALIQNAMETMLMLSVAGSPGLLCWMQRLLHLHDLEKLEYYEKVNHSQYESDQCSCIVKCIPKFQWVRGVWRFSYSSLKQCTHFVLSVLFHISPSFFQSLRNNYNSESKQGDIRTGVRFITCNVLLTTKYMYKKKQMWNRK